MGNERSRQFFTLLLVFGAVVAGMVLAGSVEVTPRSDAAPAPAAAVAQTAPERSIEIPTRSFQFPDFATLAEHVSPAVVSIEATTFERGSRQRQADPFEFFLGPRRRQQQQPEPEEDEFRSESGGSGFVISADGLIITNDHVVRGADELRVHLGDETFTAEVKGTDQATDLALLKIESRNRLEYLPLGDSNAVRVGEWVMAVGSPLGLEDTVTVGVVSAKRRQIGISSDPSFEDFIQTDAAINFGNSGGPLINLAGEVVGINTAINWGSENIGFAVPVNSLKSVLPQLRESGRVSRGYLGIGVRDLDREAAEAFGIEGSSGVLVTQVQEDLPAYEAGLRHGDIILQADGHKVEDTRSLIDYVSARPPGSKVDLEMIRGSKHEKRTVTLAERPGSEDTTATEPGEDDAGSIEWLGLRYQELTPGARETHGLPSDVEGVWITSVSPRSPFFEEGVRNGQALFVISEVNGETVSSVDGFERSVRQAAPGSRLRVYIRTFLGGQERAPLFVFPSVPSEH
jgi:serine protease Do